MGSTTRPIRLPHKWMLILIAAFAALSAVFFVPPPAAHAAQSPDGQEETNFSFTGSITYKEKPLQGVEMEIKGGSFSAKTKTDADGSWTLYVPGKGKYVLSVDESTLPKGVIVSGDSASQDVELKLTNFKVVNLFLGEGERAGTSLIDTVAPRLVNGLKFGLLLALAGMGAALIYGTTGLSNFAHGEMVTWGAFVVVVMTSFWHLPLWAGLIGAVIGGLALGLAMDAGLWRPLRRRGFGVVQLLIVSIGLSLALRFAIQFFIGGGTVQLPGAGPTPMAFGPILISWIDLVSMGICIVLILGMIVFLRSTRIGKATRAISDNPALAAATGINVDRVVRIVWMIAAVLASIAGVLWAYFRPGMKWDMGTGMLLLIFAAITLGGLGSAFGALIGSLIIGMVVELSSLWLPADLKYAAALAVLIVILLVRPQGLLGRKERLG